MGKCGYDNNDNDTLLEKCIRENEILGMNKMIQKYS